MSLILRPYQPTDANVIATWLKSEYLMRQWCADRYERFPVTPENMNSYHQQYIDGHNSIALTMVDGEEIVGYITLRTPADDLSEQRLGFVIVDQAQSGCRYIQTDPSIFFWPIKIPLKHDDLICSLHSFFGVRNMVTNHRFLSSYLTNS